MAAIDALPESLINAEYTRLKGNDVLSSDTPTRAKKTRVSSKRETLKAAILDSVDKRSTHLEQRLDLLLNKLDNTDVPTSRTLRDCEAQTEISLSPLGVFPLNTVRSSSSAPVTTCGPPELLQNPVTISDDIVSIAPEEVVTALAFNNTGSREQKIFADVPAAPSMLQYPAPLPPPLDAVISKISKTNEAFDHTKYRCTVNILRGGILRHKPEEAFDGEVILNRYISVSGGDFALKLSNRVGPLSPLSYDLVDGSLVLIRSKPSDFDFSIRASSSSPSVIIQFEEVFSRPMKERPPPVGLPGGGHNTKRDILVGKARSRTLVISDSVLKSLGPASLKLSGADVVIKKTSYYLSDISGFEPEFEYTKTVFIAGGINDLTRKRMTPEEIADIFVPNMRRFSSLYPNTNFVVSSILHTSDRRINRYIRALNMYLQDAIKNLNNVYFFNAHEVMNSFRSAGNVYTDRGSSVGIHITHRAVEFISHRLSIFLKNCFSRPSFRFPYP